MIAGRWFITPHAVRRYQRRGAAGTKQYKSALAELVRLSKQAHFVKEIKPGIELWRAGKPMRWRFIVSNRLPGRPQLITALRGHDKGAI